MPQLLPLPPAVQVFTAAVAEVEIRFRSVSLVKGASWVVAAIQRVK